MKVIEISKKNCIENYFNNVYEVINRLDGIIYDDFTIKQTFNFGNGTVKDLINYINNNRAYCFYYDLINKKFI